MTTLFRIRVPLLVLGALLCSGALTAQRRGSAANPYPFLRKTKLVAKFDADKNGYLDAKERTAARAFLDKDSAARQRRQMAGFLSRSARLPQNDAAESQAKIRPADVAKFPDANLYDPKVFRTLFLEFTEPNWLDELSAFYRTDVELPAQLTVDGKTYPKVGVRVRGTSSFMMLGSSPKKSFNLSMDAIQPKQDLYGFETLNLLNGNQDSSFLREVLFSHIAQQYLPTPRANFVKLVINGENWGVYQNAQQFNKDFLKDWYGSSQGVRWKIHRNRGGIGALTYLGDDWAAYAQTYEQRGKPDAKAPQRLIAFCKLLSETPAAKAPEVLPAILDIDEALWFCAFEAVLLPNDGYVNQGYDYRLFESTDGRFHLIPHDNNEILPTSERTVSRGGRTTLGLDASPLLRAEDSKRPIMSKLLAVPQWRARYLAHVRTLATHWLDWQVLGPISRGYHDLIAPEVHRDSKKLFTKRAFDNSVELQEGVRMRRRLRPLQWIVTTRQANILKLPEMQGPFPQLLDVQHRIQDQHLHLTVRVAKTKPSAVLLHLRGKKSKGHREITLHDDGAHGDGAAGDGVFGGKATLSPKRRAWRFYLEARAETGSTFQPRSAAARPLRVQLTK